MVPEKERRLIKADKEKTLDGLSRLEGQVHGVKKWSRAAANAWTSWCRRLQFGLVSVLRQCSALAGIEPI